MVPKTPEHDQMCNAKCIGPDLYGEMACAKYSGIYSPRSRGPFRIGVFNPNADSSLVLENVTPVHNERGVGDGEKPKTRI